MNSTEIRNEFDVLFEDLATDGSIGLDDYEKGVCLTKGQEMIFDSLIQQQDLEKLGPMTFSEVHSAEDAIPSVYNNALKFNTTVDAERVIHRVVSSAKKGQIPVSAVGPTAISQMLAGPYKYPPKDLAYVMVEEDTDIVFTPPNFNVDNYVRLYVKQLEPVDLRKTYPFTLDKSLHSKIITAAVQYAVTVYIGQQETSVDDNDRDKR